MTPVLVEAERSTSIVVEGMNDEKRDSRAGKEIFRVG